MLKKGEIDLILKETLLRTISEQLLQHYVFPEVAENIQTMLKRNLQSGIYSNIDGTKEFCEVVTKDMFNISKDKHLAVIFHSEIFPVDRDKSIKERLEIEKLKGKIQNYGFHRAERLLGNIGYIDLRAFYSIELGAETAVSMMNTIANTDALIIDLRKNGGGRGEMVAFLISYLFDEATHINSIYSRYDDSLVQIWTQRYVPGKKYLNNPIYILTSNYTFSAGEEFVYNLQHLKRAKVFGEVTGGGAHPVMYNQITENIRLKIPNRRSINPVTNSNWEGTGVIPDVLIEKEEAFNCAYKEALEYVREKYQDKEKYAFFITEIEEALAMNV